MSDLGNRVEQDTLELEKAHSYSLTIRVQDRLYRDIIQAGDHCFLTIRDEDYTLGTDDSDALTFDAQQLEDSRGRLFRLDLQASALNLDPGKKWAYTISLLRSGFSTVIRAGKLVIHGNATNRTTLSTFSGGTALQELVLSVQTPGPLNIIASLPIPEKGAAGFGIYLTSDPLIPESGTYATIDVAVVETYGKDLHKGDILFSSSSTNAAIATLTADPHDASGVLRAPVVVTHFAWVEQAMQYAQDAATAQGAAEAARNAAEGFMGAAVDSATVANVSAGTAVTAEANAVAAHQQTVEAAQAARDSATAIHLSELAILDAAATVEQSATTATTKAAEADASAQAAGRSAEDTSALLTDALTSTSNDLSLTRAYRNQAQTAAVTASTQAGLAASSATAAQTAASAAQGFAADAANSAAVEGIGGDIGQAVADYLTENPPTADVTMADLTGHAADTTAVHGIADTSALVFTTDARLSDARTPTAHTHTLADVTDYTAPDLSGYVPTTDSRLSDARTPLAHKASHATGGTDALTPGDIGAATSAQGTLAATASQPGHTHTLDSTTDTATRLALTPAERTKLTNTSGTNTGDQVLPTWTTLSGKPAVIAAGATAAAARTAIGAGTSSFSGAYPDLTGKPTLGTAAATNTTAYATAAQGAKADTALQPSTAQTINAQTGTSYTLQASDAGKLVTLTNSAAITLTVPASTFTAGQRVDCLVAGAGMVTVVGSSCTVNGTPTLVSRAQWSAFTVLFTSATAAVVVGDLASA